ncbi:hypothetical protein CROQUDRAFT_670371 [Cronartium quercuum f. sp. fusiforme G11]|uniref:Oxidoreductase AflY n=1 Tax=Cronartium quercuum f. sp. fusiforme G11 TaxID=708437 RepID=A0A9P6NQN1_9BASI|nr:hypothetical protein CROQUDRAFT_670371 [Cronartium quercuum f. sp. fusiforme G11]
MVFVDNTSKSLDKLTAALSETNLAVLRFEPGISSVLVHPGITAASAQATGAALAENTKSFHCFFNDMHFHNHIAHHLLALYSLGASPSVIKAAFENEAPDQRPTLKPVEEILNEGNWTDHLGDDKYYPNYLSFFSSEVRRLGAFEAVKHYLFHQVKGDMLDRSLSGIYHPSLWGYGLEFGVDAIVAEGLAIAAVHNTQLVGLRLSELIITANDDSKGSKPETPKLDLSFQATVQKLREGEVAGQERRPAAGLTAFERVSLEEVCEKKSNELLHWTDQWIFSSNSEWSEIVEKTEELLWLVVAMYASSYQPGPSPRTLDFGLMHCVTSFIFLPTILRILDKGSQKTILISFFRSVLALWIAQGRPPLNLAKELRPKETDVEVDSKRNWQSIITSAAMHPDEHTTKTIRTLVWASQTFGRAPKGVYSSGLPGSDELDGSIFYQTAVKTLDKHEWNHDLKHGRIPFKWY